MIPQIKVQFTGRVYFISEDTIRLHHKDSEYYSEIKDISFKQNKIPFFVKDYLKISISLVENYRKDYFGDKIIIYRQIEEVGVGYLTTHTEAQGFLKPFITKRVCVISSPYLQDNPFYYSDIIKVVIQKII
ncbi:MAG: hypothetical protein QXU20_03770 [Candidatus Woesearchaeota archaeon]